ncbi:31748_t:CDS:2 [Gigaspora margarita]|uniref:31748_t:CDS:1 n=1 Tax=Gigaspora margarita TaxID=4874 RepID=A0ABN7UGM8_GIGMA|nr:31748_t:CDS:2 [Gigaspora margarita]
MQGNKRNDVVFQSTNSGTTIPAKVTLPDINKKTTVFPRRNSQSNNSNNSSMNRFISYAGAISSQNRPPPITTKISNEIPSTLPTLPTLPALSALSADSNIKAPVPAAASVRNSTNHQWYSPFGSGLSIQFNPPVPPEDIHNKWASNNSASLADEMIRERSFKSKILNHKDKLNEGLINMDQGQNVPQFSLFDKQLSFRMYPSKS